VAKESTQKKLERVRPPRVQISYDVEIGDAIQLKELPFVLGVMADLSGMPDSRPFKERRFAEINPDNFDDVLRELKPKLQFAVENKLSDDPDAGQLKVDLKFEKLDDFAPANVAQQVKPLKELLDLRTKLADLRGTLQTNDKLDTLLLEAVSNTEKLQQLGDELGIAPPKGEEPNA
jgi:type VI secretion system protein ImpB